MSRKILVVGGLHGDEPLGVKVAKQLSGLIANPEAIKMKKRFVETDMNRSFGVGIPISLEEKRAVVVKELVSKFDLILDIHSTKAIGCDCGITVINPNDLQIKLAGYFGMAKLVIMPPSGSLISVKPKKSISLEYSTRNNDDLIKELVYKIDNLIVSKLIFKPIKKYKYAGKVLSSTLERLKIDRDELNNFGNLSDEVKNKLGLAKKIGYYPFFLKNNKREEVAFTLLEEV